MAQKALGRSHRQGLTVIQLLKMFPDDAAAEMWFENQRWPEGRFCRIADQPIRAKKRTASLCPIAAATAGAISP